MRALFAVRVFVGRIFRLDDGPSNANATSFAQRLTPEDRARSTIEPGAATGLFRAVYRFSDEMLVEIHNRTVHAAALSALTETGGGYRYYLAVYVAKTNWLTPVYMALIDPFRRWLVYPAMLKELERSWVKRFSDDVARR